MPIESSGRSSQGPFRQRVIAEGCESGMARKRRKPEDALHNGGPLGRFVSLHFISGARVAGAVR
jgi:hypothetical protein